MRNNCRVVLTDRCNLDCEFCCMKQTDICNSFKWQTAVYIAIKKYDEIAITGGEPLMELEKLVQFICLLKYFNPDAKVYLYTNGELLTHEIAITLKIAGVDGINWSPKEKLDGFDQHLMAYIHCCVTPVCILIQDKLVDDDILQFALNTHIQIKQWAIGDCDDMEPEDRYRIDWSNT